MLTLRNLLQKGTYGALMIDLGLPQLVQSLKAQAWSDEVREISLYGFLFISEFEIRKMEKPFSKRVHFSHTNYVKKHYQSFIPFTFRQGTGKGCL